ncbi:SRPBCC family protein [Actinocorallia longicatena]|uniref:Polyketide cyclase n=1 Tax=Actinocorallia longicatena TaxID=111803 RepID=A0ABP6Q6H0_9ACTN
MHYERSVDIKASADHVWTILTDVARWPTWTDSMVALDLVAGTELAPGSQVRIRQPRLPVTVWTVTEFTPGTHFTWASATPALTSVAAHHLIPGEDGTVTVRLVFDQWGLLAPLTTLFSRRLIHRYVDMEAEGLKKAAEAP